MRRPAMLRGLQGRLVVAFSLLVAGIASFVFLFFVARLERNALDAAVARATVIRDMTATSLRAALYFDDSVGVAEVLAATAQTPGVERLVVRAPDGRVVATHPVATAGAADPGAAAPGVSRGATSYAAATSIYRGERLLGRLTVVVSLADLRREVAAARGLAALVGVTIFVVGLLGVYAVATLVTRPLRAVAQTVNRIAEGNLGERARAPGDGAEVDELVQAFNGMVDTLVRAQAELERMNQTLEQRVSVRTAELNEAVEELRASRAALELSEAEARRTSETLQSLIDVAPQAIMTVDLEWRVTRWNQAAERLFGWTAAEVLGCPAPFAGKDGAEEIRMRQQMLGADTAPVEVTRSRKDGGSVTVLLATGPLRDEHQRTVGFIAFAADLTERRKLEEQLRQSQKMDALGRLAGGVAHDFNNILTVITACAELLLKTTKAPYEREQLTHIAGAAARAAALTRQLLTFTRQQVVQPRVVELDAVVRNFEPMLQRVARGQVDFQVRLECGDARITADPMQVEQMLMNLVINAADAMPEGGSLTITTSIVPPGPDDGMAGVFAPRTDWLRLEVSDTGIGMDDAVRSRVFEPFFTTKEVGKGTGLGLATTYGIVNELGGRIDVRSAPGAGATFTIYLPEAVTAEAGERDAGRRTPRLSPALGMARTVLLVEDDAVVRQAIRRTLESAGYRVLQAGDAETGLALEAEHGDAIHVVVSDVMMPGMTGNAFADVLRARRPDLGVVLVSGYAEDVIGVRTATQRRRAFVQKPFTAEELVVAIEQVQGDGTAPVSA